MPSTLGIVSSQFTPEIINSSVPLLKTTIFTVSVDTANLKASYGDLSYTYFWEVSSASSPQWTAAPEVGNSSSANFLTRTSVEPINIRVRITTGRLELRNTTTQYLKPYETPLDIPNLQLWLDAADKNTISRIDVSDNGKFEEFVNYSSSSTYTRAATPAVAPGPFDLYDSIMASRNFTFECYVWLPAGATTARIFSVGSSATYGSSLVVIYQGAPGKFNVSQQSSSSSYVRITSTDTFPQERWYHVAVTIDSSRSLKLYINGKLQGTATSSTNKSKCTFMLHTQQDNTGSYTTVAGMFYSNVRVSSSIRYAIDFSNNLPAIPFANDAQTIFLTHRTAFEKTDASSNLIPVTYRDEANILSVTGASTFDASVTGWQDKHNIANVATPSTITSRPTYQPSLSAVLFDGTNNWLLLSQEIAQQPTYSAFFVYSKAALSDNAISLGHGSSPSLYGDATLMWYNNNSLYGGTKGTGTVSSQVTNPLGKGVIATRKDEKFLFKVTNIPITTWSGTHNSNPVSAIGRYRASSTATYYHKGHFHEYIQTSSNLPDNELQLINQKLMQKWNIN